MKIDISKETAKEIYLGSPNPFKEQLEKAFGKDCFVPKSFRDIKSFEDACKEFEISNDSCRPIFDVEEDTDEIAYKKLKVIVRAINQGWTPDWNNTDQKKWYPYFNLSSGFGFSHTDYLYVNTDATVGSRLCFETQEKAIYAGEQFLEIYKEFLT